MSEFDFDELDKAVNSAMQGSDDTPSEGGEARPATEIVRPNRQRMSSHAVHPRTMTSSRPAQRQSAEIANESSAASVAPEREVGNTLATNESEPARSTVAARPLARRRTGRFMDVVHPSSDMTTAATGVARRKSVSIAPFSEQLTVEPFDEEPAPVSEPAFAKNPSQTPEPIELEALTEEEDFAFEPAQTSPFLSDAQVQKRPLGGHAVSHTFAPEPAREDEEAAAPPAAEPNSELDDEELLRQVKSIESMPVSEVDEAPDAAKNSDDAEQSPSVEIDETPAPKTEIDADIAAQIASELEKAETPEAPEAPKLAAESPLELLDESEDSAPEIAPAQNDTEEAEVEAQETEPDEESAQAPEPAEEEASETEAPVERGPSSIARQYKEKLVVASEDDTSPIFDPEIYQQPLEKEVKKKSSWGIIITILVIALLLGGAAVAVMLWSDVLVTSL